MKIHPREAIVDRAETELRNAVRKCTYELTSAERISVIARVLSDKIMATVKYQIRIERHGSPHKPGGLV